MLSFLRKNFSFLLGKNLKSNASKSSTIITQNSYSTNVAEEEKLSWLKTFKIKESQIARIEASNFKRLIFVGDIHGCLVEFQELLLKINYSPESDGLILLGDLVGKGPHSHQVFKWAFERRDKIFVIKGNHEVYLQKGRENPENLHQDHCNIAKQMEERHWEWLDTWPLVLDIPEYRIYAIHAGLNPFKPLEEHTERELTNMRDIVNKEWSPFSENDLAWAKVWNEYQIENIPEDLRYTVIFGHDAFRGLQIYDYAIGTDTGAVYGKKLTGIIYPEKSFVHLSSKQVYSEPVTPEYRITSKKTSNNEDQSSNN